MNLILELGFNCVFLNVYDCFSVMIERVISALKKRRNIKDTFRNDYGYSWDYFMAFKIYDEDEEVSDYQREFSLQYVLDRLTAGGLEVRLFYSLQVLLFGH